MQQSRMKDPLITDLDQKYSIKQGLLSLLNSKLIYGALVTVFAFSGSFVAYTYIASMLIEVTEVNVTSIPVYTLLFGIFAAIGNMLGGKITDAVGTNKANIVIIVGIALSTLSMWLFIHSAVMMLILVSLLGLFTFGSVPTLQARLMEIAKKHAPNSDSIASGLNIAGFNFAIALGSTLGALTISHVGLIYTGITGACLAIIGLVILMVQIKKN